MVLCIFNQETPFKSTKETIDANWQTLFAYEDGSEESKKNLL